MSTITIEQHWYGSAPIGIKLSRGFQTIARSAGIPDEAALERHCAYKRLPGVKDGEQPVNWGWFDLGGGRACVHRIGYSGTDEVGRPGNFLAHNLVLTHRDLALIEYDLPSLIRWVREGSGQFPRPGGGTEGFARHYNQLYAAFGKDKEKLRAIPALQAPLEAIFSLREAADRAFAADPLAAPQGRFPTYVVSALVRACLCRRAERHPVLLVLPPAGGSESARDLALVETLFTLLPAPTRAGLTFATYEHAPQEVFSSDRPDPVRAAISRRIVITTTANQLNGAQGSGRRYVCWLIGTAPSEATLPTETAVARRLGQELGRGRAQELLEERNLANLLDGDEEGQLLEQALGLREAIQQDDPRQYLPRLKEAAHGLRGGRAELSPGCARAAIDLLQTLRRTVLRAEAGPEACPQLKSAVRAAIGMLTECYPALPPAIQSANEESFLELLATLFLAAARVEEGTDLVAEVVGCLLDRRLEALRQKGLGRFLERLQADIEEARRRPDAGSLETHLRTWKRAWDGIVAACPPSPDQANTFADRVAEVLGKAVVAVGLPDVHLAGAEAAAGNWPMPAHRLNILHRFSRRLVLPLFSWWRVGSVEELQRRDEYWRAVSAGAAGDLCGAMIADLYERGRLAEAMFEALMARRELVVQLYGPWSEAARRSHRLARRLQPVLDRTALFTAYWEVPTERENLQLHRGFLRMLEDCPGASRDAYLWANLVHLYAREASLRLSACLDPVVDRDPLLVPDLVTAHWRSMELLHENAADRSGIKAPVAHHLESLLTYLLVGASAPPGNEWDNEDLLVRPLQVLARCFPAWDDRQTCMVRVAQSLAVEANRAGRPRPLQLAAAWRQAADGAGVDAAEGRWFDLCIRAAAEKREATDEELKRSAAILFLAEHDFAGTLQGVEGELHAFLTRQAEDPAIRKAVLDRVTSGGQDLQARAFRGWFEPGSGAPAPLLHHAVQEAPDKVLQVFDQLPPESISSHWQYLAELLPRVSPEEVRKRSLLWYQAGCRLREKGVGEGSAVWAGLFRPSRALEPRRFADLFVAFIQGLVSEFPPRRRPTRLEELAILRGNPEFAACFEAPTPGPHTSQATDILPTSIGSLLPEDVAVPVHRNRCIFVRARVAASLYGTGKVSALVEVCQSLSKHGVDGGMDANPRLIALCLAGFLCAAGADTAEVDEQSRRLADRQFAADFRKFFFKVNLDDVFKALKRYLEDQEICGYKQEQAIAVVDRLRGAFAPRSEPA